MQKYRQYVRRVDAEFLFGLGEACIMSYAGGDIIIVGASDRENNKNILAEK